MKFEKLSFNNQVIKMSIITTIQIMCEKLTGLCMTFEDLSKMDYDKLEQVRNVLLIEYNKSVK